MELVGQANIVFYSLSSLIIFFSVLTVTAKNPVYSALYLSLTMIIIGLIYFELDAPFIGSVQLVIYAGAVMVLFVMILMMLDLRSDKNTFTSGYFSNLIKVISAGALFGVIAFSAYQTMGMFTLTEDIQIKNSMEQTKALSIILFTDYVFSFEIVGLLLLVVAIGVVVVLKNSEAIDGK